MGLVIAILVTLAVAGSIMWVKPSKRELRVSRIRQQAMKQGLRVRLLDEKLVDASFPWIDNHRLFVLYENHLLPSVEGRAFRVFRVSDNSEKHELDMRQRDAYEQAIFEFASQFSSKLVIEAVVVYPKGLALLWDESGDEEEVSAIVAAMKEFNELVNRFA